MHAKSILTEIFGRQCEPDVFQRLTAIEHVLNRAADPLARLAALTFDGKASDALLGKAIADRLRLSNAQASALVAIAEVKDSFDPAAPEQDARAMLYRAGEDAWTRAALLDWARSAAAPDDPGRSNRLDLPQRWSVPPLPMRGADVMALGIPPGPRVGKILAAFEKWWISADFPCDPAVQQMKLRALAADG